jgi:hypothetical protein
LKSPVFSGFCKEIGCEKQVFAVKNKTSTNNRETFISVLLGLVYKKTTPIKELGGKALENYLFFLFIYVWSLRE